MRFYYIMLLLNSNIICDNYKDNNHFILYGSLIFDNCYYFVVFIRMMPVTQTLNNYID